MTNAEKFEEVFGLKLDENYPTNICLAIDAEICKNHNCDNDCPAFKFWERKYENDKTE